jgi:hypothetical protein
MENKETLEEAALRLLKEMKKTPMTFIPDEKMYSEEEVIKLLIFCKDRFADSELYHYSHDDEVKKWFEQIKKK